MEMGKFNFQMGNPMKGNLEMIKFRVLENSFGMMGKHIMVHGRMVKCMDKVYLIGPMDLHIKVTNI